jgi:chemotaxis protein MotB
MIQIGHKDEKVTMAIPDSLLFKEGETIISPTAFKFLDDLAAVIKQTESTVEFIGHSDDTPPGSTYRSNWDVAAARALEVLMYVQEEGAVAGYRLKASSRGEFSPREQNNSTDGRSKNRRVELVFTLTSASDRYFYGEERVVPPDIPRDDGEGG